MRGLVLRDWGKLVVEEIPDPRPTAADVVLRVLATGICGTDIHGFTGENGRRVLGQTMGHETVGRIEHVGSGVDPELGLSVGAVATVNPVIGCGHCEQCRNGRAQACADKVVIGVSPSRVAAFAELLVAPATNVVVLPDSMPVEFGALVEPFAVGYHGVLRGGVGPGDRVLIIGGGPIGQACVLAAIRAGAGRVALSEPDAHRRALNEALGAAALSPEDGATLPRRVSAALDGHPHVVLDAVGISASLQAALACAPPSSTIVLLGMGAPTLTVAAYEISTQERSIVGSFCYTAAEFTDTAAWVGSAPPQLDAVIEGRVDLTDAPSAFEHLAAGLSAASKVLVFPNGIAAATV